MKLIIPILILAALFMLTSCATILSGSQKNVNISSSPDNAEIAISNSMGMKVFSGKTPLMIPLPRGESYVVDFSLPGYKPQKVFLTKDINLYFFGNLIFGGLIGLIVDYSTGAMWDIIPDFIHVSLETASLGEQSQPYARLELIHRGIPTQSVSVPLESLEP